MKTLTDPTNSAGDKLQATILLVDDRPENLVALSAVLEPLEQRILTAASGPEALRHVLREDIALILLDAQMPGMDGFETARLIRERERSRHIPIIFVTAISTTTENVFQGYAVGAVDYIRKPFDSDIMRSKVKIFVDLYIQSKLLQQQAELISANEIREAKAELKLREREKEQEHVRAMNVTLEARVAERTLELTAANKDLEAFCYSVSHDLRAPLRSIMSTSKILLEDAEARLLEEDVSHLQRQVAAAGRMDELIDDLLELSRLGRKALTRTQVDVTDMAIKISREMQEREWPAKPQVKVAPDLRTQADPGLLAVLLTNLIENAFKYSPKGGMIEVGALQNDSRHPFYVRDHGIGFDMRYVDKLFQPFERLVRETEYPGTGIGLANAHRVVVRHGGSIWAESKPGKGSTFFFTL